MSHCVCYYLEIDVVIVQHVQREVFGDDFCSVLFNDHLNVLRWWQSDDNFIASLIPYSILDGPDCFSLVHTLFTKDFEL